MRTKLRSTPAAASACSAHIGLPCPPYLRTCRPPYHLASVNYCYYILYPEYSSFAVTYNTTQLLSRYIYVSIYVVYQ